MIFVSNAEEIAKKAMDAVDDSLTQQFIVVVRFWVEQPDTAPLKRRKSLEVGSEEYIYHQAIGFSNSRKPKLPQAPKTVPDELVSIILSEYFEIPAAELNRITREHLLSMGAENIVGDLLERYIASILENEGWVWCAGAMVKAADFIKPPSDSAKDWRLLQVKNRDNSENSSSSAIRAGTKIEKWFRTFSRKTGTNWEAFPEAELRHLLSEDGFKEYAKNYLANLGH
jgi:SinI restriction endonuclease